MFFELGLLTPSEDFCKTEFPFFLTGGTVYVGTSWLGVWLLKKLFIVADGERHCKRTGWVLLLQGHPYSGELIYFWYLRILDMMWISVCLAALEVSNDYL